MAWRVCVTLVLGCMWVVPAAAQSRADSAAFIIRIGNDTTVIERHVRTADRIVMEAVQRSPATALHRLTLNTGAQGRVTGAEYSVTRPPATTPASRTVIEFRGDSAVLNVTEGTYQRTQTVAARDAIPLAGPFYGPYELAIMRAVGRNVPRSEIALLSGANVVTIPVERVGRDSVRLENQFAEPMRAHVDAQGRLLHLHTPAFTTVERIRWVDLDRLAADFARRDAMGRGMGPLSPRQTTRSTVSGANIWLDYSRPAMRGRPIWGGLVPWGAVWRMGANDAAHIATDRTLEIGNLTLQPGTYSMFLLPTQNRWSLIINRATGMSGLDYDEALDLERIPLTTETVERPAELFTIQIENAPTGPRLAMLWDRTRAYVPFRVR